MRGRQTAPDLDSWLSTAPGFRVLDGGLATLLEARGHAFDDALWSARLLADDPDAIVAAHREYLEAGAECITTASYQATLPGFAAQAVSPSEAVALLRRSVELAVWARADRPAVVAASIGPYGAALADGSEYRGDDGLTVEALAEFHRERFDVLAATAADLLAFETIPSAREAEALLRLLARSPRRRAWLSFSLRDCEHLADGQPIASAVAALGSAVPDGFRQLCAIGVNCVPPPWVSGALDALERCVLPKVVYPNSGERWDAKARRWCGAPESFTHHASAWRDHGALLIGGCCRTGPEHTRSLCQIAGRTP